MTSNSMLGGLKRFGGLVAIVALLVCFLVHRGEPAQVSASGKPASGAAVPVASHQRAVVPRMSGGNLVSTGFVEASLQRIHATPEEASSELKWLNGTLQTTYDRHCFDPPQIIPVTSEFVSYWGNEDGTSPAVGDIFYGRVAVAGVGNSCAGPYAQIEVRPPPGTSLAIDSTNKVHCSTGTIRDPKFTELPESECPQSTWKGTYGYVLNRATGLPWDVSGGKMVIVAFPLISTRVLAGGATGSWLTAGVHALDGWLDPWDTPKQSLFVADNPPTIQYDGIVTTTENSARTSATLFNHYKAGKAYFDLGTTTKYDVVSEPVEIRADANAYRVYESWQGLDRGLSYHWRVRFITSDGKTYDGADQTFVAQDDQPAPGPSATPRPKNTPGPKSTPKASSTPGATATPKPQPSPTPRAGATATVTTGR